MRHTEVQQLRFDRELFERELDSFVPPRVFDVHAHLYKRSHFKSKMPYACTLGPQPGGWEAYRRGIAQIIPRRTISGLFFCFPDPQIDFTHANGFVSREVRLDRASRAEMLVHPGMDPEFIRETVRRERFVGLKCYHFYSCEHPTWNAPIPSYLPDEQVRVAHEEGLAITLHVVRPRALADRSNQEVIRRYARRYPNARLILAHAGRGFNPYHTVSGVAALRGISNVWFDTSAITDSGAFEAIVRTFGVDRLLYGSDFPVSHIRGRVVGIGDSFLWVSAQNTDFSAVYGQVEPTLVGLESLRTLKLACINLNLSDTQIEAIFYANAKKLLGLKELAGIH